MAWASAQRSGRCFLPALLILAWVSSLSSLLLPASSSAWAPLSFSSLLLPGATALMFDDWDSPCPLPGCPVGVFCTPANASNCASRKCTTPSGALQPQCFGDANKCGDGVINFFETGVDCGGGCIACNEAQSCFVPQDCRSGICANDGPGTLLRCRNPTCKDRVGNGREADVDCGTACCEDDLDLPNCLTLCQDGYRCSNAIDCISGTCASNPRSGSISDKYCAPPLLTTSRPLYLSRVQGAFHFESIVKADFSVPGLVSTLAFLLDMPSFTIVIDAIKQNYLPEE